MLWVYDEAAIFMHPVITSNAKEPRAERLDDRVSYGRINVSADFFKYVISPSFISSNGIVYELPETRSVKLRFSPQNIASADQPQGRNLSM